MTKTESSEESSSTLTKKKSNNNGSAPDVALSSAASPPEDSEAAPPDAAAAEDRTVSTTEDYDNEKYDDDDTGDEDGEEEMPLLHYSRLFGAGLSRTPSQSNDNDSNNEDSSSSQSKNPHFDPPCTCSELTVIRVDPEDLTPSSSTTNATFGAAAPATTTGGSSSPVLQSHSQLSSSSLQLQQQQQLLTSDLWQQPHLIMACGWQAKNAVTLTNVQPIGGGTNLPVAIVGMAGTTSSASSGADAGYTAGGSNTAASIALMVRDVESTATTQQQRSVVDMSFDASGTVLGAIDDGGTCAIWEMKYTATLQPNRLLLQSPFHAASSATPSAPTSTTTTALRVSASTRTTPADAAHQQGNNNMFSNWMSALTGMPPSSSQSNEESASSSAPPAEQSSGSSPRTPAPSSNTPNPLDGMRAVLTAQLISQPSRINYPASWGPPTCMVLEPAFKRKREKSLLVGFANGRLVLTKRGTFFQRRNDTVVYQAGNYATKDAGTSSHQYRGIETVAWRGSLVAWADANGIKLLDMEHLTRIAHIDRPTGARPSLYPTVKDLQPTLFFETSNHLLVAWGDCLMQMQIDELLEQDGIRSAGGGDGHPAPSEVKKRRTVQCTMAWELDCVACDAVPMDANHIAVLGLVPLLEEDEEKSDTVIKDSSSNMNDVELQILSRNDGSVSHCDALPLLKLPSRSGPDSALPFRLLSTFALPRMEDSEESKVLQSRLGSANDMGFVGIDVEFDLNQNLFSRTDAASRRRIEYRDPHLQWKLDSVVDNGNTDKIPETAGDDQNQSDDTESVDSDDYECIMRPIDSLEGWRGFNLQQKAPAPTMIVCSASDAVLSHVSTIDDAVANALARNKCALSLKVALRHRRKLRQYDLEELANRYLEAVLRISGIGTNRVGGATPPLSLRRMQLAVKAMPILFGNKIPLWERWTTELENIPGALFLVRNYLPVRDPVLPPSLYERTLEKLLLESENLTQMAKVDRTDQVNVDVEGARQFLESLTAWGTTKVLKEYIRLYKYSRGRRKGDKVINEDLKRVEVALQRRYLQTAAIYMQFPVRDSGFGYELTTPRYDAEKDDSQDSLFDVTRVMAVIARRAPLAVAPDDPFSDIPADMGLPHMLPPNNQTRLEAMARLRMMQGRYDLALKCFLAIGAFHSTESLESFEGRAIGVVNGTHASGNDSPVQIGSFCYDYIMSLIESQHLNQYLLQDDFLLSTDSKLFTPLFALLRLVGLQRLGNFLIEHCVSPDFSYNMALAEAPPSLKHTSDQSHDVLRREPLPLDKVAKQLEGSPALLHWYLHLVFTRRPELYINFPNNAVPPKVVTSFHRKHFRLYVNFAGELRNSSKALASTQQYNAESMSTPLMSFLKASLPLGGLLPIDARRVLEIERSKNAGSDDETEANDLMGPSSPFFALELAYIIENYSDLTEKAALGVLNLYLNGCKSLILSVLYAQRQKRYSSLLWDKLIGYCTEKTSDGILFGELLESAAYSGADLARLVERIPPGMVVVGLRPRLVAAVADYRMKLEIYTAASAAGSEEAIVLMREIAHRSRRGVRSFLGKNQVKTFAELIQEKNLEDQSVIGEKITEEHPTALSKDLKIKPRLVHHRLAFSISRR